MTETDEETASSNRRTTGTERKMSGTNAFNDNFFSDFF